ncbi:hypothetical protein QN277_004998 [Acacia crassicarpa]|uniref:Uncharacterized protein n=1 Tax=Acacia crassicarpa TaxID=499986 RepID=A0AAE1JVW6_9FABA|nr:hypothetical protein QN277_004998 [Acacia crassicarpa]
MWFLYSSSPGSREYKLRLGVNTLEEEQHLYACVNWPTWPGWPRLELTFCIGVSSFMGALISLIFLLECLPKEKMGKAKTLTVVASAMVLVLLGAFIFLFLTAKRSSKAEPIAEPKAGPPPQQHQAAN